MRKRWMQLDGSGVGSRRPRGLAIVSAAVAFGVAAAGCVTDTDDEPVATEGFVDSTPTDTEAPAEDEPVATDAAVEDEPVDTEAPEEDPVEDGDGEEADPDGGGGLATCGDPGAFGATSYGSLSLPDGPCDAGNDPDAYIGCSETLGSCSLDGTPAFGVAGTPGTNHQEQIDDSASTLEELFDYVLGPETSLLEASATCSGRDVAGTATATVGSTTEVGVPLYSYGPCTNRGFTVTTDGGAFAFPQVEDYVVDASEPDPTPFGGTYAIEDQRQLVDEFEEARDGVGLFGAASTINNTLSGSEGAAPDCTWFFEPRNVETVVRVLDSCSIQSNYWVFAAGLTEVEVDLTVTDTVMGTTSTYTNPLGIGAPAITDTQAFDTSGPTFDRSVFPCGFGHLAYTACAEGQPPMNAGAFVTVSASTGGTIPLAGDGTQRTHAVDFASSGGPRYSIEQQADGWTVASSVGPTRARALFRDNSVTLVVPNDELPEGPLSSQWSVDVDGDVVTQPPVPVVGLITTPVIEPQPADEPPADEPPADEPAPEPTPPDSVAPPEVTESLPDFYAQLSASVSAGDLGFSLDRLDERVLQAYPDSCPAALESFADPDLVIEFVSEGPIEDWVYEANGQSFDVPGSQAVQIRLTGRGQTGDETTAHLSIVDGTYRWFTFC